MASVHEEPPEALICPITLEIMRLPVVDSLGHTFERAAIEAALREKPGVCPKTNQRYPDGQARLTVNHAVRKMVHEYEEKKGEGPAQDHASNSTRLAYAPVWLDILQVHLSNLV